MKKINKVWPGGFLAGTMLMFLTTLPVVAQNFPAMKRMKILQEYPVYEPDNLWDYIDGAADNYLNYQFRDLHIAEYTLGRKVVYKVEIYRHEDPENAFGIYSSERSPDYHFIELGTQGYSEHSLVHFLKGSRYVKVLMMDEKKGNDNQLMELAKKVEASLPGPAEFPEMLGRFPEEGKVSNSERFLASDFLGRSYLNKFYTAQYRSGDQEFTMFLRKYESPEKAQQVLARYYQEVNKTKPADLREGDYRLNDGYNGIIYLIWKGDLLFGFQNIEDESLMRSLARQILEK